MKMEYGGVVFVGANYTKYDIQMSYIILYHHGNFLDAISYD